MLRIMHRRSDGSFDSSVDASGLPKALSDPAGLTWVDFMDEPPDACARILSDVFHFHPLAIDDALKQSHVPKIDDWETYLYIVLHAIAFAPPQELRNPYVQMSRAGWHLAMDISVYSLVACCRAAAPLMTAGGAIVTLTYYGGEKVMPGYNVMGVCKAALEHSVRYLAWDLGRKNIRVNALSAGPVRTLSSAGIADFDQMQEHAARKSCLGRNVSLEELGATGVYLLSPLSGGVTGETIHVDCGYSIIGL